MIDDQELEAIQVRAKRAHDHVCDIARQKARWKMTIPANEETDSDLLLSNALTDVPLLVAEIRRLRSHVERRATGGIITNPKRYLLDEQPVEAGDVP